MKRICVFVLRLRGGVPSTTLSLFVVLVEDFRQFVLPVVVHKLLQVDLLYESLRGSVVDR